MGRREAIDVSARTERLPGAVVSVGALLGLILGARSLVAWEPPRLQGLLGLSEIPREELGLGWYASARWPADLQAIGVERIAWLVAGLLMAGAAVALVGSLLLLFEAGSSHRRAVALRSAVGAPPSAILLNLLRRIRTLALTACTLGLLLGLTLGALMRTAWPGTLAPVGWANALETLLAGSALLLLVLCLSYLWAGLGIARGAPLAPTLLDGGRSTAGRGDASRRRVVPAVQMGIAGSVVIAALAIALPLASHGVVAPAPSDETAVLDVTRNGQARPGLWIDTLTRIRGLRGVRGSSAATPGALLGLGPRASALAECGDCIRGLMVAPFWAAMADHHSVAPGYFADAGVLVTEGRDFTPEDGPEAPPVAIVNRTFANTAFERGRPIGKRVRLGPGLDDWYTVVGIVEDFHTAVVGGDDLERAAVYVSLLQRPARSAQVLVTGTDAAVRAARDVLERQGFTASAPKSLSEVRAEAAAPLAWAARVATLLCLLALALAVLGARATALHITRLRGRELAVRRALGAGNLRIVAHVLGGAARSAGWGAALATIGGATLVGVLRKAVGGVPAPGPGVYLGVTGLLVCVALMAALRAGREALDVEPAAAMD
jgi:hypothetical protein